MGTEHLDIPKCPKCALRHRYRLAVERTIIVKLITMGDKSERPRRVRITRLFTCPTRNEEFEATFVLTDTSSDRIRSISVDGIADANDA